VAVAIVYWAAVAPLAWTFQHSGNVWSRYMTIESIVERGTLAIERSPLLRASGTPDIARFDGHYYSDKPPVLPALGAVVYAPLAVAGVRFTAGPAALVLANWVLVVVLVGGGSALGVGAFRWLAGRIDVPRWAGDLLALAMGFGTLLLTYGVTFNNHSVAAGLLTAAVAMVYSGLPGKRLAIAGFMAGLAATIDLPAGGAVLAGLGIWSAAKGARAALFYGVGSAGPLVLHVVLQSRITGTPLPVEFYPEAFEYPGSYWTTEAGRFRESGSRCWFLLETLVGPQGWWTVTPLLLFGMGVACWVLAKATGRDRGLAGLTVGVVVALLGYYVFGVRRTDYAGQSFGVRHLLPVTPLVFWWACWPLGSRGRGWWAPMFVILWSAGAIYAYEGRKQPWTRIESNERPLVRAMQRGVLFQHSSYKR
jgi:hypothetical protein